MIMGRGSHKKNYKNCKGLDCCGMILGNSAHDVSTSATAHINPPGYSENIWFGEGAGSNTATSNIPLEAVNSWINMNDGHTKNVRARWNSKIGCAAAGFRWYTTGKPICHVVVCRYR